MSDIVKHDSNKEIQARFKPRARLLIQLGDQLIKNESIALVELVKNSYDADASEVNIYMENVDSPEKGIIIIEDDGYGMTVDVVENVWLEPGSDFKSKKISQLEVSPKFARLPIGEKGIGRFGVHKLGSTIEMTTKAKGFKEVFVKINWLEFDNYKYLEDVPITIIERDNAILFKNGKTGTNIVISDLNKKWERGIAREVKRSITALSSPFENIDSFKPNFDVFDKPGWFEGLLQWENVKQYSLFRYKITMEGNLITSFEYNFTPWATMTKLFPKEVKENNPLIETFCKLKFTEGEKKDELNNLNNYQIGKVIFEGYIFDQDSFVLKLGLSDKEGFKKYLKSNGGIRVYRDKLRVYDYGEPESDWLGLDYRRFQQPTKHISNNNILGAVYIERKDSSDLIEKTNREGFVENDAYQALRNALLYCLDLVETLRLTDKMKLRELYGPTPKSEPVMSILGEAKRYVDDKVKDSEVKTQIVKYLNKIETDYKRVNETLLKAAGAGLSMSVVIHEVEKIIYEVNKVLKAEKASDRVLKLVQHLSSLIDGYSEIIRKSGQTSENVIEIIDQALFNTEYRLSSHKIEVIKEYKKNRISTRLKIAKSLLIGSMMNIVDNAIYWLDQKGFKAIDLNEAYQKKLYIDIQEEQLFINIIFADNGTGFLIPTDNIVEPFVTGKPNGMGLGLNIANEIMEAQNGRLIFPGWGDFELPEEYKNGATIVLAFKK